MGKIRRVARLAAVVLAVIGVAAHMDSAGLAGSRKDQAAAKEDGQKLYTEHCAVCHDRGLARAPSRAALAAMSPDNIRLALTDGKMSAQGSTLTRAEVDILSRFLGAAASTETTAGAGCSSTAAPLTDPFANPHWSGWGGDELEHRFQSAKMAGLTAADVPRLKLKWAFGFPGVTQAYSQPAVAGGRLFVGSAARNIYSLDAKTGCTYWKFQADAPVRTAISIGRAGDIWAVYFGDQHATAYAVNADTGALIWKTRIDDNLVAIVTGAPVLADGKVFVPMSSYEEAAGASPSYQCCKFRGSISALDAATGRLLWKTYTISEEPKPVRKNKSGVQLWGPSGAAIWSSPSVDLKTRRVYVATGDSYSDPPAATSDAFMAFDLDTGKLVWTRQITANDAYTVDCGAPFHTNCPEANGPDFDFGSSPMLVDLGNGHRALIAGQKSGVVHAVDPDRQGAILWQRRVGKGGVLGGVQWGPATDGTTVFVAVSDVKILSVKLGTPGAQPSMFGANMLDPAAGGGLFALNAATGEVIWQTPHPGCNGKPGCSPAQSAAVTAIPGAVFSGGLDGHLRAYSAATGKIIWDVDTAQDYQTVNGVKGKGGALDAAGAVIVDGILYVNSGYGFVGSAPGNVLLAFSVDGK